MPSLGKLYLAAKIVRYSMVRKMVLAMTALLSCSVIATNAQAHAKLTSANPPADAVIAQSPKELRMTFNESLIPKFSGVELKTQQGQKVETGMAAADPADKKQMVIPLPAVLADGVYSVKWHAVSEDTHHLEGTYSFTVKH